MYHVIKILRRLSQIEFYVDGKEIKLNRGNHLVESSRQIERQAFPFQRRLRIGNFKNNSQWNGIIAGRKKFSQQKFFQRNFVFRFIIKSSINF